METSTETTPGPFVVERVNAKIASLERRAEHLQRRIKEHTTADRGRSFDITELQGIEAGISALRVHRSLLDPVTSPVLALAEMLDSFDEEMVQGIAWVLPEYRERAEAAVARARRVLKELGED